MESSSTARAGLARALRRHLVLVMVLGLLGALAGGSWGVGRDRIHEAKAVILVAPLVGNPYSPENVGDQLVNLTTEAELVTSDAVARRVSQRIPGHPALQTLLRSISVNVPPNTQILEISAHSRRAADAVAWAQGFAESYLAYRRSHTQATLHAQSVRTDAQIRRHSRQVSADVDALATAAKDSPRALMLHREILDLSTQIAGLRTQLATIDSASLDPGQLLTPAVLSRRPPWSLGVLGSVAGLLFGLVLALMLAAARTASIDRVDSPADLAATGLPVLAGPDGPGGHGFRQVRTVLLGTVRRRPMVVLLSSARKAATGRTGPGLATSLASAGLEVVLVDLLDSPEGARGGALGFADVVLHRATVDDALVATGRHVQVLGASALPTAVADLDDLIATPEATELIRDLGKRADVVLLSAGSASSPRTQALAQAADAVLVEVVEHSTTSDEVEQAVEQILQAGGWIAGLVYLAEGPKQRRRFFPRNFRLTRSRGTTRARSKVRSWVG